MFDYGYACEQSWPQVKRQDRICGRGQILALPGKDMIEIRDDCTEQPEPPKLMFARWGPDHSPHQEKPSDFDWRCPGSAPTPSFIVQQLFTSPSCMVILPEREGDFTISEPGQQRSAMRAGYPPTLQLASEDRFRLPGFMSAVCTALNRSCGDQSA